MTTESSHGTIHAPNPEDAGEVLRWLDDNTC
jgi:hypothetical protein